MRLFFFMEKHFVYIIKSDKGNYYIGQTNNLEERLIRHNQGRSIATKNKGIWKLVINREVKSRSEAVRLERKLKNMKNSAKAIDYLKHLV